MDYKSLAATILDKVGGKENVNSVVHCATRLRLTLKDESKAQTDILKKTAGVLSVVNAGGQYQIVIGPDVPVVYQEVLALGNFEASAPVDDPGGKKGRRPFQIEQTVRKYRQHFPADHSGDHRSRSFKSSYGVALRVQTVRRREPDLYHIKCNGGRGILFYADTARRFVRKKIQM